MATFDENKLDLTTYDLSVPFQSIKYQSVVEEFMEIVRTRPAYLVSRTHLFSAFAKFVDHDDAWPLAVAIVPEFHLCNNIDTTKRTAINIVLEPLKHRLSSPLIDDPDGDNERLLVKRFVQEEVDYMVSHGKNTLTTEERREAYDLVARALPVIGMSSQMVYYLLLESLLTSLDPLMNLV